MTGLPLLHSFDLARFVARGFLRMDAVVPDALNRRFMAEAVDIAAVTPDMGRRDAHRCLMQRSAVPEVVPSVPFSEAYAPGSALAEIFALPHVAGAIRSLVGPAPLFDHHYLHVTYPPDYFGGGVHVSQPTHQDSTVDPQAGFDLQVMYYPHDVTPEMGGTRFIPGTHLRIVNEMALARCQNMVGQQHVVAPAGTLLFLHHGIWHGGGLNRSASPRTMYKVRVRPTVPQVRWWDMATLPPRARRPAYFMRQPQPASVEEILTTPEPWFESDTAQLEFLQRIKLWRHLLGDPAWDVDDWLTRLENPARRPIGG